MELARKIPGDTEEPEKEKAEQAEEIEGSVTEFDSGLWGAFVDRMTVMADGKKVVRFKDGNEVDV